MEKKYLVEESHLTSIADIIRNKTGLTNKLTFPDQFFEEIRNIETSPATALPVLDMNYPEDVIVMEGTNVSASFGVIISEPGIPDIYTYQWYENGNPIEGATNAIYNKTTDFVVGNYSIYCEITNEAGTVMSRIATLIVESSEPIYTYSGMNELIQDSDYNYRIKFKTSGNLIFSHLGCMANGIDVFCVGGGGGGAVDSGGGGGGGYTKTAQRITSIIKGTNYTVTVGAGGATWSGTGGESSIKNGSTVICNAAGGNGGSYAGGAGGSGGGGAGNAEKAAAAGAGGSNGENGGAGYYGSGSGQGTTTREFGESTGALYAGGGGGGPVYGTYGNVGAGGAGGGGSGGNNASSNGTANTGGGGGARAGEYGKGGSGIVIIRNHRS